MPEREELVAQLTRLVLEDPREARRVLTAAVDGDPAAVKALLDRIAGPSDTRLRNLVANIARNHAKKLLFVPYLVAWRDKEADEFTRRSILAALEGIDEKTARGGESAQARRVAAEFEAYTYIGDRLKHRIRNAVLGANAHVAALRILLRERTAQGHPDPSAEGMVTRVSDSIKSISREVGAIDVDPTYFELKSIVLAVWIREMGIRYGMTYSQIPLHIEGDTESRVFASDFLLELIFLNLWTDAHQYLGPGCEISLAMTQVADDIVILISDSGDGFPASMAGVAFEQPFSTNSEHRGRGLLEVRDAVTRLGGTVALCERAAGDRRVRIVLPDDRSQ